MSSVSSSPEITSSPRTDEDAPRKASFELETPLHSSPYRFVELLDVAEPVPTFEELLAHGAFESHEQHVEAYKAERGTLQPRDVNVDAPKRAKPSTLRIDPTPPQSADQQHPWCPPSSSPGSAGRLSPLAIMKRMTRPVLASRALSSSAISETRPMESPKSPLIVEPRRAGSGGPVDGSSSSLRVVKETRQPRKLKKPRPTSGVSTEGPSYFDYIASEPEALLSPSYAFADDRASSSRGSGSFQNTLSRSPSPIGAFPSAATREAALPPVSKRQNRWSSASSSDSYHGGDEDGHRNNRHRSTNTKQSSSDSSDSGTRSPTAARWSQAFRNGLGRNAKRSNSGHHNEDSQPNSPRTGSFEVLNRSQPGRSTPETPSRNVTMSTSPSDAALDSIAERAETPSTASLRTSPRKSVAAAAAEDRTPGSQGTSIHTDSTLNRTNGDPNATVPAADDRVLQHQKLVARAIANKQSARSLASMYDSNTGLSSSSNALFFDSDDNRSSNWRTGSEGGDHYFTDEVSSERGDVDDDVDDDGAKKDVGAIAITVGTDRCPAGQGAL